MQHQFRDRQQLIIGIVRKIDVVGDAGTEARIAGEKLVHPVAIAGEDHHQILALRFHDLQQNLDCFLPVVAFIVRPVQVIGLVDEQHATHRLLQDLLGLRRGVTDVLAHQFIASD